MLKKIRNALEKTKDINRSAYIWNALNAMISALESPVILMVLTRTNGVYDAGVFSISFAIAGLMLYVGLYGLRRFQSSDVNERFTFGQYHGMRIISCVAMLVASIIYCIYSIFFNDYTISKTSVVLLICLVRCIQAYSDVYHGRMQQKGRLDVATKSSAVRYVAEIVVYAVMLIITHNLIIATIAFAIASFVVMMLTSINVGRNYCDYKPDFTGVQLKLLIVEGFPLFVSLFLNMYISNAPKYAIDAYLTEETQAVYNMIFMPAFMVMLLANFIFNPILTTYAEMWLAGTKEKLRKLIKNIYRQMLIIAGLTGAGLLVAFTIGIPLLSIIFGVDLGDYKPELCVVMIGGGALAYATFFSTVITIIRIQKSLLISYGVVAIGAKLLSGIFVTNYGMMGAAALYAVLMTLLAIILLLVTTCRIKKEWKKFND